MNDLIFPFHSLNDFELSDIIGQNQLSFFDYKNMYFDFAALDEAITINDDLDPNEGFLNNLGLNAQSNYFSIDEFNNFNENFSSCKLSLIFNNIRSIHQNFENFCSSYLNILQNDLDILGFCETRLNDEILNLYKINNYNLVSNCRNTKGGGVALFVKDDIEYSIINEITFMKESIETLFIKCKRKTDVNIVGIVYRRPNSNIRSFLDYLDLIVQKIKNMKLRCNIMGDFNLDLLKYENNNYVKEYISIMLSCGFFSLINRPTRVHGNSATLIDHLWSNDFEIVHNGGILVSDTSDHFTLFSYIQPQNSNHDDVKVINYRLYDQESINLFNSKLSGVLNDILVSDDANECYERFHNHYSEIFFSCFPLKFKALKMKTFKKPWINNDLKILIKDRHKLQLKYLKRPLTYEFSYKKLRNELNNKLKLAKIDYFNNRLNEAASSSKETWNVINNILNKNSKNRVHIKSLKKDDDILDDTQDIVEYVNEYFTNIGSTLASTIPDSNVDPLSYLRGNFPGSYMLYPTSPEEVRNIIVSLKKSSPGFDEIPCCILKNSADVVSVIMSKIINLSFSTGVYPEKLKIAKVIAIYKSGEKTNISNYRPISLLSIVSKIFERAIYVRFYDYFKCNDVFSNKQFGFRKYFSTCSAILNVLQYVINNLDDNKFVLGVFLDLKKAFDTVDHVILLRKLEFYGIRGLALTLMKSYLTNRQQFVQIDNYKSSFRPIYHGVPQGSILGPLLFLIYINDIIYSSNILNYTLFADDTCLVYSDKSLDALIQNVNQELIKICNWLNANKLSLNLNKCNYMLFCGRRKNNSDCTIRMMNVSISRVNCTLYLGILIDDKLRWSNHIDNIISKISRSIGVVSKINNLLNNNGKILIYYSLIYPYLQYCNLIWGMAGSVLTNKLQVTQNRAIRLLFEYDYRTPLRTIYNDLPLLKVSNIHKLEMGKLFFSQIHINNSLGIEIFSHSYHTRQQFSVRLHRISSDLSRRFVIFAGGFYWNSLPSELILSPSLICFKKKLKQFLLNSQKR